MKSFNYLLSFLTILVLMLPAPAAAQLFEDFEDGTKGGYAAGTVQLSSGAWMFDEALIGSLDSDKKIGTRAARIRNGHIEMQFDTFGAGEVSFYYAHFGNDSGALVQLQYSEDGGSSWTDLGDELQPGSELEQAVIEANIDGNVRFRILSSEDSGSRINIDNFEVTEFVKDTEDPRLRVEADGSVIPTDGSIDYSNVLINRTAGKTLSLSNTGQLVLEITSVSVTGDGFSLSGDIPSTLEPSETSALELLFEPKAAGDASGTLTIASNDPDVPEFEAVLTGSGLDPGDPIDIADARDKPQGTLVSVSGWVTVTDEFSGPIYFQDETAGIAAYYSPLMRDSELGFTLEVSVGDSIVVTGPLSTFFDLVQIAPTDDFNTVLFQVYPEGRKDIEPRELTLEQLETGNYEGQLVQLDGVRITDDGRFAGETNYEIEDPTGTSQIRISRFTDIPGMTIPFDEIRIVGAASRFRDFIQVFPRDRSDFIPIGDAPIIISDVPYEVAATSSSITFEWETDAEGTSEIRYGLTDEYELGIIEDDRHKLMHILTLEDLDPATVYNVQLRSAFGEDTTRTSNYLVTTSSPEGTTQEINVYFNRDADLGLATFEEAVSEYAFDDHLIGRINNAGHSLDLAFYSISGEVGDNIASAIANAYNRGLEVRVIVDHTTSTDAFVNALQNSSVPVIESNFGDANRVREGIHHNKYAVIDYKGGDPEDVWLITSSWNATDNGTNVHYQNMIEFQDVAIAGAYTREFNQKWGSETTTPDASRSRFGSQKIVVNPSTFWIGDSYVRLFFSPQGNTEAGIIDALTKAEHSVNLGTMLITRTSITNALFSRNAAGVTIRGVMGQPGQQGSQFDNISAFADMHTLTSPLLHHKYAVIDGEQAQWNGRVITGSHNWSSSANRRNDENTIIIQDARIANLYIQEFASRYRQAGGLDDIITVDAAPGSAELPQSFRIRQNYPNPFNPTTIISFDIPRQSMVSLRIYDALGRRVASPLLDESLPAGTHHMPFDASHLSSGVYIYRIQLDDGQTLSRSMTLIK